MERGSGKYCMASCGRRTVHRSTTVNLIDPITSTTSSMLRSFLQARTRLTGSHSRGLFSFQTSPHLFSSSVLLAYLFFGGNSSCRKAYNNINTPNELLWHNSVNSVHKYELSCDIILDTYFLTLLPPP